MIKGLITSLLVSMGVVSPTTNTPSFIHKQPTNEIQIKYANNYNQSLMGDNLQTESEEHTISQDQQWHYFSQSVRRKGTSYNAYFHTIYNETIQTKGRGQQPSQIDEYITESQNDTTQLTIVQLDNYRYLYESTIDLNYTTYIRSGLPNGTKVRTYLLTTTDNISTFINTQNWSVYGNNYATWEEIISPEHGFTYTIQYQDYPLTQQNTEYYVEIEFENIPIVNEQSNYIVIYTYLILPTITYSYPYVLSQYSPNYTWIENDDVLMYGDYVIPADNYEVIDIPGLMFTILTMPFSFISTAFNLTLFPGTPYQVNLSQLFLIVLGLLIFIWIIKKIIQISSGML